MLKSNKLVLANFISKEHNFYSSQILFNVPKEFAPKRIVEIPLTGTGDSSLKGVINAVPNGEIIFHTSLPNVRTLRLQGIWETE